MNRFRLPQRVRRAFRAALAEVRGSQGRSGYDGATMNRLLMDWVAPLLSADQEIERDIRTLRARARELGRNNSYAKRYFRMLVNNVIGPTGIRLQAKIQNGGVADLNSNVAIEAAWKEWANGRVTVDGKLTLRQFEILMVKTLACDGEVFIRLYRAYEGNPYGLALQFVDADMVDERFNRKRSPGKNEVRMGVEIDEAGVPVGYHMWKKPPHNIISLVRERDFIPAADMHHIYMQDRVNQTRGVTWLHSVMVPAHMLDAYEQSEAVAARISAAKMGFLEKPEGMGDLAGGTTQATMEASPGTIEILKAGYEFKAWDPDHPTSQFASFVKQLLRKIASGFSVFSNVLANDAEGVSYSSMRSFLLIERDDWRSIQQDVIDMWRRPLYTEWLAMALLTGALQLTTRNPANYMAVRHRPRGWPWIDPEKEAKGAALSISNGLTSRTALLAEKGEDIEDVLRELKAEKDLAESLGLSISGAAPTEDKKTNAEWEEEKEQDGDGGNGEDRTHKSSGHRLVTGFSSDGTSPPERS